MREESIPDAIKDVWVKYWKSMVACAILGAIIAGIWVQIRPGSYTARAELVTGTYALGPEVQSVSAIAEAGPLGLELPANSQAQLIDSPATAQHAAKALGDDGAQAVQTLVENSTAAALTDNTFAIESTAPSAEQAVERANAMAKGYLALRAERGRAEFAQLSAQTGLNEDTAKDLKAMSKSFDGGGQVYRPATTDQTDGPVNPTVIILIGGLVGALIGFILALVRRVFTRRVRTDRDLAQMLQDDLILTGRNSDLVMLREAARGQLALNPDGPLKMTLISPNNPQAERVAEKTLASRLSGDNGEWIIQRGSDPVTSRVDDASDTYSALGIPVIVVEKGRDDVLELAALRNQLMNLGHSSIAVMLVGPVSTDHSNTPSGTTTARVPQPSATEGQ